MSARRIRHTVTFSLVHAHGAPDQLRFVQERWLSEVGEFLELDYAAHLCQNDN